jgi:hypothetical protein
LLFQPLATFDKEPPATDDLTSAVEAGGDLAVFQSFGGQQNHLGTWDLKIRKRMFAGGLNRALATSEALEFQAK